MADADHTDTSAIEMPPLTTVLHTVSTVTGSDTDHSCSNDADANPGDSKMLTVTKVTV